MNERFNTVNTRLECIEDKVDVVHRRLDGKD